ncbi:hypothetical protein GEV29_03085 [Aeromicrobium sp. SMF47]|uniref:Uncharacterized protein n=1 Tax=Aeromicrobium yanjiei TaxID=2662028 RepID=A0A5Q2MEI8_9ACTN|nr:MULTISPECIES: hypothetical protein [Aeromicrobium]MRJ75510.1 hypothetical protein [Aeromicrobium yanjiei]MRK02467.1 hypothetical protein [Aeromicrobium sp. S22]QGG40071.1 hypothetical protein GEV26_01005 [Aeromicrobium yanjiei]
MTTDLHSAGPTVTVFGVRDALGLALAHELDRRGCSTHAVTTALGWLTSTTNAVVRLDTMAGEQAFRDLVHVDSPAAHVVAVCEKPADEATSDRLVELCRQCGDKHDVSLIWHAPLEPRMETVLGEPVVQSAPAPKDLALTIADEVGNQVVWTSAPSFAERTFEPGWQRGTS